MRVPFFNTTPGFSYGVLLVTAPDGAVTCFVELCSMYLVLIKLGVFEGILFVFFLVYFIIEGVCIGYCCPVACDP
jgi:hypothetical protein